MTYQPAGRPTWRSLPRDLAYVVSGFFITLIGFIMLVPLTVLGIATAVIWIGVPILGFALLLAGALARENRALLARQGLPVADPAYRRARSRLKQIVGAISDPQLWKDLLHGTMVTFPLRITTFVLSLTWLAAGAGGVTFFLWAGFLPDDGDGLGSLLFGLAGIGAGLDPYLLDAAVNFVIGILCLVTAPWVIRLCTMVDGSIARVFLTGSWLPDLEPGDGGDDVGGHDDRRRDGISTSPSPRQSGGPQEIITRQAWMWSITGFASIALLAVGIPVMSVLYGLFVPFSFLLIGLHCIALAASVKWPHAAIALSAAVLVALALSTDTAEGLPYPVPVTVLITQTLLCLLIAARNGWATTLVAALASLVAPFGELLLTSTPDGEFSSGAVANLIAYASILALAVIIGIIIRQWLLGRRELLVQRERTAEVEARQAVMDERHRIARELHDVVAHSLSVISIQASTARFRLDGVTTEVADELDDITASARRSLTEMRGLLAVLRDDDGEKKLAPSPDLAQIPELIDTYRRGGASIELSIEGDVETADAPASTALSAYRIIQEAVTNAVRHAPGSGVQVQLMLEEADIYMSVTNSAGISASPPASGHEPKHGLIGMRERAQAAGGSINYGFLPDGGYQVSARLPRSLDPHTPVGAQNHSVDGRDV
ncbi:sensor histidine kinase [Arthrobacter pigmenti]